MASLNKLRTNYQRKIGPISRTGNYSIGYIYIYIYGAPILDVSRSHTTTQHSR